MLNIDAAVAKGGEGPNMDATLSFLISAGIMAFGVWIVVGTVIAGSPMAWTFTGLVPMVVGSISLSGSQRRKICVAGFANRFALLTR
jgi:hypothetical protein